MSKNSAKATNATAGQADTGQAISLANPQAALDQFKLAANVIEQQYPGALSAFQSYVTAGQAGALDQNTQALLASLPISSAATAAMDELRGFMGLPSISPTAGLSTSMNGLINQLANDPNATAIKTQLQGLRDQLQQAESITDPAQREQAKQQISGQLSQVTDNLGPQYANLGQQLSSIANQFNVGYGNEAQSAWSPDVVQAKLEASPAYQFRLNQGMKALERTAAAKGNLLSGNTLAAAQTFGQNLASQEYDNRIRQLQQTISTQAPGVNQQVGLLQGAGSQLSQTGQQLGAASGDTLKSIAQAGQQASNLSGQGLLSSTALQSQLANQGSLTNAQLETQAALANAKYGTQASLANTQTGTNTNLLNQLISKV